MKKNIILICFISLFLLAGCKTLSINSGFQTKTTATLVLGSIGSGKKFILQNKFNNVSYPTYTKSIKVSALKTSFNKTTYQSFVKAKQSQSNTVNIKYIDSIKEKPYYLELHIADKVTLINMLNDKINDDVKEYLSLNPSSNLVTNLSIALNQDHLKKVVQAKSIFLIEKPLKTYTLKLLTSDNKTEFLNFNEGIVFGYKSANCCWQENGTRELNIVDLVSTYSNCPNNAYRSASRAKKKINYFKL